MKSSRLMFLGLIILLVIAGVGFVFWDSISSQPGMSKVAVQNFEECVAAGYPVSAGDPQQCSAPDGTVYFSQVSPSPFTPSSPPSDSTPIAPSDSPSNQITVRGEIVCLPHKDTTGGQTLECAYGLRDESGTYYALRPGNVENNEIISDLMAHNVAITGTLSYQENSQYQNSGFIDVELIQK